MRGADDLLEAAPARDLIFCGDVVFRQHGLVTPAQVTAAWHNFVGGPAQVGAVVLVRNVARARRLLLQTLNVAGRAVYLPANATHGLVEEVKRAKAHPVFAPLDAQLNLAIPTPVQIAWAEPVAGLPIDPPGQASFLVIDHADTVPIGPLSRGVGDVLLFGLQLSANTAEAGALLCFRDATLAAQASRWLSGAGEPDWARATWQVQRLAYHLPPQQQRLAQLQQALTEAVGIPLRALTNPCALAHGIAVQVPQECTAATFYHYAQGENTPVAWLPFVRPLHPAAAAANLMTAAHLERWLLAPLGLHATSDVIDQTVLGIAKAAEYLGVRWYTNPQRAAAYAYLLTEMYGPEHDAYRPAFETSVALDAEVAALRPMAQPAVCKIY